MTEVQALAPAEARVERLVERLVRIINEAYAIGEAGLWLDGASRTDTSELGEAIRRGEVLVATGEDRIEGCVRVQLLDAVTADLGMLAVTPDRWGSGVGRQLVRAAEEFMRSCAVTTMQLELLVPTGRVHAEKERLLDWYTRLGYRLIRSATPNQVAAHLASQLRVQCEFLILHKALWAPTAGIS